MRNAGESLRRRAVGAVGLSLFLIVSLPSGAMAQVVNGDFETDAALFEVWPGYTGGANPDDISGWTGAGGRGVNGPIGAGSAFHDNGGNPTNVAFIQGAGHIEQVVGGFVVGDDYILKLDYNARNCCGGTPTATFSMDGVDVGTFSDIQPVGGQAPWYHLGVTRRARQHKVLWHKHLQLARV